MAFIDANRDELGVEPICTVLQVAPSTYYAAKARRPSARATRDAVLIPRLRDLWRTTTGSTGPASCGSAPAAPAWTWAATRWPD